MKYSPITKILMTILSILIVINIYVTLRDRGILEVKVRNLLAAVNEAIDSLHQPDDGKTPIKGVDYFDGERGPRGFKGEDGKDSLSTHTVETIIKEIPLKGEDGYTPVKGVDYFDGKTPVIRCNESKNRWEVQYIGTENWSIIKNENGEPAQCSPIGLL